MKSFRKEVAELEHVRQELANAEKLFDLPITMYPDQQEVQKQMKGLEMIYSLYEEQLVGTSNMYLLSFRFMVFNTNFNNISVMSSW